jgi:exonuclease VII small subunit
MRLKEIINKLEMIEGSLDDAFYSLPEYNANTDSRDYIDSARSELYCLKDEIEKVISDIDKVTLDEVFNTPPYHAL